MFVITRNGKTTVYSGWRAWLMTAAAIIVAWFVLAALVFFVVGVALTAGVMLLLALPALIGVGLLGRMWGRDRS